MVFWRSLPARVMMELRSKPFVVLVVSLGRELYARTGWKRVLAVEAPGKEQERRVNVEVENMAAAAGG